MCISKLWLSGRAVPIEERVEVMKSNKGNQEKSYGERRMAKFVLPNVPLAMDVCVHLRGGQLL